jgi:hypothetical protein
MKRLAVTAGIALVVALAAGTAIAKPRFSVIHLTQNFNKSLYPAECLGTITTETLPSLNAEQVTWLIRNGNAHNTDDVCPNVDKSQVELHFKDDVMGVPAMRVLKAQLIVIGGVPVWAVRGTVDPGIPKGAHQYSVWYKGMQAGPDPEIEVACDGCGGGGK